MSHNSSYSSMKRPTPENQFLLKEAVPRNGTAPRIAGRNVDHEKEPFMERAITEPVRLTPAWEETNLPNDELNFKGVTMEQADLEMNPPHDRFMLVFLTLLLHGIGTLMPWNMFITAKAYFVEYKLSKEYTGIESDYATNFLPYLGFAAQIPNLIFNWLNIFVQIGGNLTTRIVWSILVEVLVFVLTVILAMTDSSSWPGTFFWSTMTLVIILNMGNGVYQNTVFGMAAKLPFKYTGAVILGANISGTFTAVLNVVSSLMTPNARTAAIYYFITALFVLLACFDTYFALPLNRFFRYHELVYQKEQQKKKKENRGVVPAIPYWTVFVQCFPQCFNVFFVFFVTLAVFPAVHSDIRKSDPDFLVSDDLYTDVMCFLTFNICAMLGSFGATWLSWPGPRYLVVAVVLRVLFIPFFLVCNYHPFNMQRVFPIFVTNDWVYWVGGVLLGLTGGHFSSLAMQYCPRSVEPQYASTAGMFGGASLITGLFIGLLFSLLMPLFVSNVSWDI